jgi:pimeloyl-ACP methyl ester carboxylesterase
VPSRRNLVLWMAVALALGVLLSGVLVERRYRWQLRRLLDERLEATGAMDVRLGFFPPDGQIEIERSGGLRLVAREYVPDGETRATILLLHGYTPKGSGLALYRILGRRLATAGYRVVAPDFAGFGRSGDPFSIPSEGGFRTDLDVRAWLDRLAAAPRTVDRPTFIVAHSAGVSAGLPIGLEDPGVSGIAAIGPSRNVVEDMKDPEQEEYWWRRVQDTHRQVYSKDLPAWYTRQRWLAQALGEGPGIAMRLPMERYLPLLQVEGHRPVLLVDGERELQEDRAYLEAYYEAMAEPKDYRTLARSDHYSNVGDLGYLGAGDLGPLAVYDREVVEATVALLDQWITGVIAGKGTAVPNGP